MCDRNAQDGPTCWTARCGRCSSRHGWNSRKATSFCRCRCAHHLQSPVHLAGSNAAPTDMPALCVLQSNLSEEQLVELDDSFSLEMSPFSAGSPMHSLIVGA